jgi:hypothetical protein
LEQAVHSWPELAQILRGILAMYQYLPALLQMVVVLEVLG